MCTGYSCPYYQTFIIPSCSFFFYLSNCSAQWSRGLAPSASFHWGVLAVWGIFFFYLSNCSVQQSRALAPSASFHGGVLAVWGIFSFICLIVVRNKVEDSLPVLPFTEASWLCEASWDTAATVLGELSSADVLGAGRVASIARPSLPTCWNVESETIQICVGFTTNQKRIERAILSLNSSDMNFDLLWVNWNRCSWNSERESRFKYTLILQRSFLWSSLSRASMFV